MAAPSSTGPPPSQDAIASLITQVSPTGQPARAPSRPVRPRQGQPKKAATGATRKTAKAQEADASGVGTSAPHVSEEATSSATPARQLTDDAAARESTAGTEETAIGNATESSSKNTSTNQSMHPTGPSESIATPTSAAQPSKHRPSSQDGTSTTPKLAEQHSPTAHKPKQLQNGAPTASTSTAGATHNKKSKRKSWVSSLFSSCFTGGSGHDTDEDGDAGNAMTEPKAGTANASRPARSSGAAGTASSGVTGHDNNAPNTNAPLAPLVKGDDQNDSTSKLGHATDSTSGTGTTASRDISTTDQTAPLTTPAVALPPSISSQSGLSLSPNPDIAPEVLAASQAGGTPLSRDETGDVLSGAVQAPGSEGLTPKKEKRRKSSSGERSTDGSALLAGAGGGDTSRVSSIGTSSQDSGEEDEEVEDEEGVDESEEEEYIDEEERIIAAGGMGIPLDENGNPAPLLKELTPAYKGKKCLVLDLDETLVHSSFKLIHSPDFVVPVEIENQVHNVYVIKRPGVDAFMKRMGELYEVVVFTASLSKYADPVLDHLDIHRVVEHRLFRESCYNHRGNYVKDLSQLGRPIGDTIIIDNSPASYIFHPNNAVPVSSWFNDPHDTELTDLQGFLTDLAEVPDVRGVLDGGLFPLQ